MSKIAKSKRPRSTTVAYVFAVIVGLIGIASLVNTVKAFTSTVAQYVAVGYAQAEVVAELLPGQLLPGIFQAVAMYGGMACVLALAGIINHRIAVAFATPAVVVDELEDSAADEWTELEQETAEVAVPEAAEEVAVSEDSKEPAVTASDDEPGI